MTASARRPPQKLDAVAWAELHHAYGPATDVPAQLIALSSPDVEERRRAHHELGGNVYHQGTRWQVSRHVVPFLAELADDPATPDRAAVVGLLRIVALGDRDDTHLPFAPDREFARADGVTPTDVAAVVEWLYGDGAGGDEPERSEAVAASWDRDAYLAAAEIRDRFAPWTGDPDPLVAAGAAELLAWFPPTRTALDGLIGVPATGPHRVARASANLSLAFLAPDEPSVDDRLTALLTAGAFGVRLTAAVALALRLGDRLPDDALHALADARDRAGEIDTAAFPLPWDRSLLGFAALALYRIGLAP